jgi:uncharacterized heparinase superfamily protein
MNDLLRKMRRGLRKPPRYILERITYELQQQAERYLAPRRIRGFSASSLARAAGHRSTEAWWDALAKRPYVASTDVTAADVQAVCLGDEQRIHAAAERAIVHEVDLLGSGPLQLGPHIDWHRDYKTGHRWEPAYCRDIEYNNLERPSDVKFPWELSRMQWMIPLGQAYRLMRDERYAAAARELLESWMEANPYAASVNWACTMDVALRIVSWTWLFHAFKDSTSWSSPQFRQRFLQMLYLHGDFTARNLEKSDVNGNHYTADAAGLVFAGLFFGDGVDPASWLATGWNILCEELQIQVYPDGVDFEASVPYHRLVQELFLLPALYRMRQELDVPAAYRQRLIAMARFTAAYSRPDGSVPLWGDADDARTLPFGGQSINDHRYLLGLTGTVFGDSDLQRAFSGPCAELLWLLGADAASALSDAAAADAQPRSSAFPDGGFFILRNNEDHVFVDCGPLGMSGRGGHGHNDVLSFEAVLDRVHLVTDCGAYLYTADYRERNLFRSTAFHNTPRIDEQEINRFVRPEYLWQLHDDAAPEVREVTLGPWADRLTVSHGGYRRLESPVTPVRTFELEHATHRLTISDEFDGVGDHTVEVPLHLAPGVEVQSSAPGRIILQSRERQFCITWHSELPWVVRTEQGRVSSTYGVAHASTVLIWQRTGPLAALAMTAEPLLNSGPAVPAQDH